VHMIFWGWHPWKGASAITLLQRWCVLWKQPWSESHQWKTKMCGAKDSGNPRFKCLQATTHSRAKTMTQTLTKHKDKKA